MELIKANKAALVVIDLQNGIVNGAVRAPHSADEVVHNAQKLAQTFIKKGGFVVLVHVSSIDGKDRLNPDTDQAFGAVNFPEGWDHLVPQLAELTPVHTIVKRQWGAFYGTDLDLQLRRRKIDTIVLCGISTSIGVDMTAREAYQHGYHQVFAEDAMSASTKEEHEFDVKYIFPKIGKVRTCEEIIHSLEA